MSNILNKSHPFRASVTHEAPASGSFQESSSAPTGDGGSLWERANAGPSQESRELESLESAAERFRRRAKLLGASLALCILWYGYITIQDMLSGPEASEQVADISPEDLPWDEESFANRDVEEARSSQGLFQRLFCSSGRRSTFCD